MVNVEMRDRPCDLSEKKDYRALILQGGKIMIITLKDGSKKRVRRSKKRYDIAMDISEGWPWVACGEINGEEVDLRTVGGSPDCELKYLDF